MSFTKTLVFFSFNFDILFRVKKMGPNYRTYSLLEKNINKLKLFETNLQNNKYKKISIIILLFI
uniref:T7N9.33 n=1 Tax=Arabidopsis thaliana TaxID=3702 RepID=Q9LFW6_ARATH|nr:T7N9.33 [Arabidopsis thaliana]